MTLRSAGYCFWIIFSLAIVYSTVNIFKTEQQVRRLFKVYLASFVTVAILGLLQFAAATSGMGSWFVTQWWIEGKLPRINGLSYEPSYFATYLSIGWVMIAYLTDRKSPLFKTRTMWMSLGILSTAILLSSSRLGIVMVFAYAVFFAARLPAELLARNVRALTVTSAFAIALGVIGAGAVVNTGSSEDLLFLLDGTGIGGTAAHSVSERRNRLTETAEVFLDAPLIGRGPGGVAEAIAIKEGRDPADLNSLKLSEAMCITVESLAGSGCLGVAFLAGSFVVLTRRSLSWSHHALWAEGSAMSRATVFAFLAELVILQFNQNILRPYVWFHVAVACTVAHSIRPLRERVSSAVGTPKRHPLKSHRYSFFPMIRCKAR